MIGGAARVSEGGVLVRKECRIVEPEPGRLAATDRSSGGLGEAEGND